MAVMATVKWFKYKNQQQQQKQQTNKTHRKPKSIDICAHNYEYTREKK